MANRVSSFFRRIMRRHDDAVRVDIAPVRTVGNGRARGATRPTIGRVRADNRRRNRAARASRARNR